MADILYVTASLALGLLHAVCWVLAVALVIAMQRILAPARWANGLGLVMASVMGMIGALSFGGVTYRELGLGWPGAFLAANFGPLFFASAWGAFAEWDYRHDKRLKRAFLERRLQQIDADPALRQDLESEPFIWWLVTRVRESLTKHPTGWRSQFSLWWWI